MCFRDWKGFSTVVFCFGKKGFIIKLRVDTTRTQRTASATLRAAADARKSVYGGAAR